MCTVDEEADCKEEFGENIGWTCKNCPKARWDSLDEYTIEMLHVRTLRMGGFPFRRDELTLGEWADQGVMAQILDTPRFI